MSIFNGGQWSHYHIPWSWRLDSATRRADCGTVRQTCFIQNTLNIQLSNWRGKQMSLACSDSSFQEQPCTPPSRKSASCWDQSGNHRVLEYVESCAFWQLSRRGKPRPDLKHGLCCNRSKNSQKSSDIFPISEKPVEYPGKPANFFLFFELKVNMRLCVKPGDNINHGSTILLQ